MIAEVSIKTGGFRDEDILRVTGSGIKTISELKIVSLISYRYLFINSTANTETKANTTQGKD